MTPTTKRTIPLSPKLGLPLVPFKARPSIDADAAVLRTIVDELQRRPALRRSFIESPAKVMKSFGLECDSVQLAAMEPPMNAGLFVNVGALVNAVAAYNVFFEVAAAWIAVVYCEVGVIPCIENQLPVGAVDDAWDGAPQHVV